MGTLYKAEKRVEHYAAPLGPLFDPSCEFSKRRVPRIPLITFEGSTGVADAVKGNSYANIVVGAQCKGAKPGYFLPLEGNPKENAQGRPVCFHGNYGMLYIPNTVPQPGAINCGLTEGEGVDCLGEIEATLDKLLEKFKKELDNKSKFMKDIGTGMLDGAASVKDDIVKSAGTLTSGDFWSSTWESVKSLPGAVVDGAKEAYETGKELYSTVQGMSAEQIMDAFVDFLIEMLNEVACHAVNLLNEMLNGPKSLASQMGEMMGVMTAQAALSAAGGAAVAGMGKVMSAGGKMGGILGKIGNPLPRLKAAASRAKDNLSKAKDKLKAKVANLKRELDNVVAKLKCAVNPNCPVAKIGHKPARPVNPVLGCKVFSGPETADFTAQGVVTHTWQRYYVSSNPLVGVLGQGWRLEIEYELHLTPDALEFIDQFGRKIPFSRITTGQSSYQAYEQLTLSRPEPSLFTLAADNGTQLRFVPFDPRDVAPTRFVLQAIEDRNGNRVVFERDALTGLPVALATPTRRYQYLYVTTAAGQRLGAVEELLADGTRKRHVQYEYDAATGDLRGVETRSGPQHRYEYLNHMLVAYATPDGARYEYEYDRPSPRGKVLAHRTSYGDALHFDYQDDHTVVRDHSGAETIYHFNADHRWTGITDPSGQRTTFTLDSADQVAAITDPLGRTTSTVRNSFGQPVLVEDASGAATMIRYHPQHRQPIEVVDAQGHSTHYDYDSRGNLAFMQDPTGAITRYRSNPAGQPEQVIDARGGAKFLNWDAEGNLLSYTDCSGQTTQFAYDRDANLIAQRDACGQVTRHQYDAAGRLTTTEYPDGSSERLGYDALGRLTQYTDAKALVTHYGYNASGLLAFKADPLGQRYHYEYDAHGQLIALTNPNRARYTFTYDAAGNLVEERGFDGKRTRYLSNAAGEVERVSESDGRQIAYRRDANGRITETLTGDQRVRFEHDVLGRVTHARNAHSHVAFTYTPRGEIASETSVVAGQTFTLRHTYDVLGNRSQTLTPHGRTINYLYYGSGHLHQVNIDGEVVADFERDALHREIERSQGALRTRFEYDPAGRLTRQHSRRDEQLRLERLYQYAPGGELIARHDHLRGSTFFDYDPLGRLIAARSPKREELFSFDPAHNLIDLHASRTLAANEAQADQALSLDERQQALNHEAMCNPDWDPLNDPLPDARQWLAEREAARQATTGAQGFYPGNRVAVNGPFAYTYDRRGRTVAKTESTAQGKRHLQLVWNAQDQLAAATRIDEHGARTRSQFLYDPFGRRVAKTVQHGKAAASTTLYLWSGDLLFAEFEGNAARALTVRQYLYTPQSFAPLAQVVDYYEQAPATQTTYPCRANFHGQDPDAIAPIPAPPNATLLKPEHRWTQLANRTTQEAANAWSSEAEVSQVTPVSPSRTAILHYHNDAIGTPQELTAQDGRVVWMIDAKAWGRTVAETTPEATADDLTIKQPLRFQGQYEDPETGLHYNRHRYYDPDIARFVSQDPIGLAGGNNLYQYAPNSTGWIDPLGLAKKKGGCNPGCPKLLELHPKDINFAQRSVNPGFDTPLGKIAMDKAIQMGSDQVAAFPPISVINVKGQWVARDGNSRLLIARETKAKSIAAMDESSCEDKRKDLARRLGNNKLPAQGTSRLPNR